MGGAMRTGGSIQHSYNTFLNEQNIFKNPYKFFIICYTLETIFTVREREKLTANFCINRED